MSIERCGEILSLSPEEVAENTRCSVVLPALQRDAVWRPHQVEEIWDSLLRGFPIGSFLLTPIKGKALGQRQIQNAKVPESPKFYLLDGQQRWSAISLGFQNIWQREAEDTVESAASALWIDLQPPEIRHDGRRFIFRILSRSHPWGFSRDTPRSRLRAEQRRKALQAYEFAYCGTHKVDFRPGKLLLSHAWPWDSKAPVPFPILIKIVQAGTLPNQFWAEVEQLLQGLPYWNAEKLNAHHGDWKNNVLNVLRCPGPFQRKIIEGTKRVLALIDGEPPYQIPIQIQLPNSGEAETDDNQGSQEGDGPPDGIETLFVRVNSAGTALEGEELRFSILKSAFPEIQRIVERLDTKLMSPARLVTLVSRLVLAHIEKEKDEPPGEPEVARFRRLVNDPKSKFRDLVLWYLGLDELGRPINDENGEVAARAKDLLEAAGSLLVNGTWGLPPVLQADLVHSAGGVEAFFFLLAWLDRMLDAGLSVADLCDDDKRRVIGTVTTLGWFAERPFDCLRVLWPHMSRSERPDQLFSVGSLLDCIKPNESGQLRLIPPLSPDCLIEAVATHILSAPGFDDPNDGKVWKDDWRWRNNFTISNSAQVWLKRHFDSDDNLRGAWQGLVGRLWNMRSLIIYAQREKIIQWFVDYNPVAPDQVEDADRPWDFDHIHPSNYGGEVYSVPRLIKEWHKSIGNLRAWPLEVNRSLSDTVPGIKLNTPDPKERGSPYHLTGGEEIRNASFIAESTWSQWRASTPDGLTPAANYLVRPREHNYGACRCELIQAITGRWVALYREWYDSLLIASLFDSASA